MNLYCYCYYNPISYSDPSGNLPQWAEWLFNEVANGFMWGAISGAVTGALTSGINIATGSVKIVGSAQKTGSLFHQFASNVQARKMSLAVGRYSEIHLNRSKGLGIRGFRPDVTGVTKNGLRVVEVVSSSQTYASQVAKVGRMMGQYDDYTKRKHKIKEHFLI